MVAAHLSIPARKTSVSDLVSPNLCSNASIFLSSSEIILYSIGRLKNL